MRRRLALGWATTGAEPVLCSAPHCLAPTLAPAPLLQAAEPPPPAGSGHSAPVPPAQQPCPWRHAPSQAACPARCARVAPPLRRTPQRCPRVGMPGPHQVKHMGKVSAATFCVHDSPESALGPSDPTNASPT